MSAGTVDKPETYREWFKYFLKNPTGVDNGKTLLLAGIPMTLCSVLLGFSLFPPGVYPRLLLMAPGLLGAVALLYILGFILFLNKAIGTVVACLVGLLSLWWAVTMIGTVYH
jgi:hypothetical protein